MKKIRVRVENPGHKARPERPEKLSVLLHCFLKIKKYFPLPHFYSPFNW